MHICLGMYVYIYVCMYVYIYIYVCMYVYIYVCMYVCMYTYSLLVPIASNNIANITIMGDKREMATKWEEGYDLQADEIDKSVYK